MEKYHRLACEERYQLEALFRSGHGVNEIARFLKRSPSSISRELRRHGPPYFYSASRSVDSARERSRRPGKPKLHGKLLETVRRLLCFDLSPEQIAGYLRRGGRQISHETIYRYIYADFKRSGDLWTHLRRRRRWRRARREVRAYAGCGQRLDRTSIEARPKVVEDRTRLGDFERDTVKGKDGSFLTTVDRKSKLVRINEIAKNSGMLAHEATVRALKDLNAKTITNDNGPEFCDHQLTANELGVKIYFSHPYASWERGTNENINGLIRQYFSRKTTPTPELARFIEDRLNNRPRKGLGYRTPNEVHGIKSEGVALAG